MVIGMKYQNLSGRYLNIPPNGNVSLFYNPRTTTWPANFSTLLGLIQTAEAEYQIAVRLSKKSGIKTTSSTAPKDGHLIELIPALLAAVEEEVNFPQDVFQAQVCLGWLHWTLSEPNLAASRLPRDFDATLHTLSGDGQLLSAWTEVCIVKGGYMKGMASSTYPFSRDLTIRQLRLRQELRELKMRCVH
jgi:hypothetical protein